MGLIKDIFNLFGYQKTNYSRNRGNYNTKHHYSIKIGYIVHTSESADCNGTPIQTFYSRKHCFNYAKKLAYKLNKNVYVYKVNLNHHSLGTGDSVEMARYGIYKKFAFRN